MLEGNSFRILCGGTFSRVSMALEAGGLSPQLRGNWLPMLRSDGQSWTILAATGEPRQAGEARRQGAEHPASLGSRYQARPAPLRTFQMRSRPHYSQRLRRRLGRGH